MHHSRDQILNEDLLKQLESASQEQGFGATGLFPDGQLDEIDEGELRLGITTAQGKVVMNFGEKPIKWIGFDVDQAIEIGRLLIERGLDLKKEQEIYK